MTFSRQATTAIRAAKNRKKWGKYATRRFIFNQRVSAGLYRLACQLEALEG